MVSRQEHILIDEADEAGLHLTERLRSGSRGLHHAIFAAEDDEDLKFLLEPEEVDALPEEDQVSDAQRHRKLLDGTNPFASLLSDCHKPNPHIQGACEVFPCHHIMTCCCSWHSASCCHARRVAILCGHHQNHKRQGQLRSVLLFQEVETGSGRKVSTHCICGSDSTPACMTCTRPCTVAPCSHSTLANMTRDIT